MVDDNWNARAAGWDDDPDVAYYADRAYQTCERFIFPRVQNLSAASVLDFGCGTGLLAEKLSRHVADVVAIDTAQGMIDILRNKIAALSLQNVSATCVDILDPSAADYLDSSERFDLITASSVCSFLDDYSLAMIRLSAFLKPGGVLVQWDWAADMPRPKVADACAGAGLQLEHYERVFDMAFGEDVYPVIMAVGRK